MQKIPELPHLTRVLYRGHYMNRETADLLTEYLDSYSYRATAKKFKTSPRLVRHTVARYRAKGAIPDERFKPALKVEKERDPLLLNTLWAVAHGRHTHRNNANA